MHAFLAQKHAQAIEEEKEAPEVELKGEDEPEFEMIPNIELGEYEKMQSHPSSGTEVFLDHSNAVDIEFTQEKPQQLEEVGRQGVVTQEPTPSKTLVEAATQVEEVEPEVDTIPDHNLEDLEETPE